MNMSAPTLYQAGEGVAYERFLGRWTQLLARRFVNFARLPPDGDLLDAGCGTGSLAEILARRYRERAIVGVDVAESYLSYARSRQTEGRMSFRQADIVDLPFEDGAFAGTLAQLVLNFVPEPARAVQEMIRVTRPGGVVAGAVWDFRGGLVYQRLFWDTAAGVDPAAGRARDRLFSHPLAMPEGLATLWRDAGLDHVERASLTVRMDYGSFEDYWEPILGGQGPVGSYLVSLDPARQALVRDRVRDAYLSGAPDGPRSMTATAWAVRGVRR